jgi:hypothetical protein
MWEFNTITYSVSCQNTFEFKAVLTSGVENSESQSGFINERKPLIKAAV